MSAEENKKDNERFNRGMRVMEFPEDGYRQWGENDEDLFRNARLHADHLHPERGFTDEQLRRLIAENAYDIFTFHQIRGLRDYDTFSSPNTTLVPLSNRRVLVFFTGVIVLDLKGSSNEHYVRKKIYVSLAQQSWDAVTMARHQGLIGRNSSPEMIWVLEPSSIAPCAAINAVDSVGPPSGNNSFAVDVIRSSPPTYGDRRRVNFEVDVAVRGRGACLGRIGYNVAVLGELTEILHNAP